MAVFKDEFVANIQTANKTSYNSWKSSNPKEAAKWEAFRDAVIAGKQPTAPVLATKYGKALVAAGKLELSVTDIGSVPSPAPPPPPPPTTWEGPTTFTDAVVPSGGLTVTGRYFESTSATPAVSILTARPITFRNCGFRNITGPGTAYIFDAYHGTPFGTDITIDNCVVFGVPGQGSSTSSYINSARWLVATNFKSLIVTNCTIENTRGMELWEGTYTNATCQILRNRHHNVLGHSPPGDFTYVSNFVQMRDMQNTSFEIGWNEIYNEYDHSEAEDLVSIHHTQNVHLYDNMFWHHSALGNAGGASTSGITGDASDPGPDVNNCVIERNQIVDGMGILMSVQNGGSNNIVRDNRVIADNFLPNGQVKANGFSGLDCTTGGSNNHFTGNLVGYIGTGGRQDGDITASVEGWAGNTHLGHNPTNADEQAEWTFWQNKLAANNITIGAGASVPAQTYLFQDDFSVAGAPSATDWWAIPWCSSSPNDAQGCYNTANAYVASGSLNLKVSTGTMGRNYDFATIETFVDGGWPQTNVKHSFSPPVHMEARIKWAPGAGMWGGWWMMSVDGQLEIDVIEWRGLYPQDMHITVHGAGGTNLYGTNQYHTGVDLSLGFHTYAVDYYTDHMNFLFDGSVVATAPVARNLPVMPILQNVVGPPGTWGGEGGPPPANLIPAIALVDYVRVWAL